METTDETYERQIDELSALKAIFGNDLIDLRQSHHNAAIISKKWSPLEVQITLKPMVSMSQLNQEVYVQLDLYVKCGKRYPNVIPEEISFRNIKGLADSVCQQLKDRLYELAKSLRGEVMIFSLAEEVRHFLHSHNKPPVKSFYDQMISHKTKLEFEKNLEIERQLETNKRKEQIRRKQLEEELQRKQMALFEESRYRRESREDIGDSLLNINSNDSKCFLNHELISILFDINGVERRIQRGKCLFHNNTKHSIEYLGIDLSNGQTYVITEWIVRLNKFNTNYLMDSSDENSVDDIVNRITQLETFFKTRIQMMSHSNLIRYLSIQFAIKSDYIVIDLLQEHIYGNSLRSLSHVMRGQPFNTHLIRHYSKKILEALNFLHKNNCPHGFLKETNVFIDSINGDIKINGYYFEKQFYDLCSQLNTIDTNANSSKIVLTNSNRMKIRDVFDFGLLVIAISNDWNFIDDINPSNLRDLRQRINRSNCSQEFKNFIDKCIESEENGRWTPDLLLTHPFILSEKQNFGDNYTKANQLKSVAFIDNKLEQTEELRNDRNTQNKVLLNSIVSSSMSSRLTNEFEILDDLGKGGFGYVYKVKNILDGRCYALKKIPINPSNHSLYEKIRREVNLLSRLNHENVVRYFTSWIEIEDNVDTDQSDQSSSLKTSENNTQISSKTSKTDTKSKTSEPLKKTKETGDSTDSDSDSDSDSSSSSGEEVDFEAEEDIFGTSFLVAIPHIVSNNSTDDQYVVFEGSGDSSQIPEETQIKSNNWVKTEDIPIRSRKQYMFIQMELCEKSTLRDAIDNGLHSDSHRKRRLFREIVEGMVHIHEQGMIHRDLKPGNIFLDVNDHVKIGDFGLAKEIYLIKDESSLMNTSIEPINITQESDKYRLTGVIGTPLYVAPELTVSADTNSSKIFYTQKVDIYSLGIIFFEMSYPFQTLMERTKVVMNLRKKEIILPKDCNQYFTESETQLLKSLLQHDYSLRPSSSELLTSECLPAPEMEEKEEQNVIRRAVQNSRTKLHKYMLNELFQKETSEIEDFVFDVDDQQFGPFVRTNSSLFSFSAKQRVFQYVYSVLESIMQSHCAVYLSLPTLVPKHSIQRYATPLSDVYYAVDNNGTIVSLPHDLRVPFARYISRNKITHFRRYSIEKVYRQRRVMGYHPKELWECAFDIVTPKQSQSNHIMPDTEVLSVLSHVINQFPGLHSSKLTLKVNHIKLIKAILDYCDVAQEVHNQVICCIGECNSIVKEQNVKESNDLGFASTYYLAQSVFEQKKKILEKCMEESKANSVLQLLELEQQSIKDLRNNIKTQMRRKGTKQQNALEMAKKALNELDLILKFAEKLGNLSRFSIRISPSFVMRGSSSVMYSGFIFQLDREIKYKKSPQRQVSSVIAVGGRYDELITSFDIINNKSEKRVQPKGAVGLSIEFEKLMKCILDEENKTKTVFNYIIDVVVCSITNEDTELILRELCSVTKEFWNSGLKVFCFPEDLPKNIDELHAFCLENSVRYSIALKEISDPNQTNFVQLTARLFAYEKERHIDKKAGNVADVVEYVIRTITSLKNESNSVCNNFSSDPVMIQRTESNKMIGNQSMFTSDSTHSPSSSFCSNIRVTFICDKLQVSSKKRHESNIITHLSTALSFVANHTIIEVIAVDLPFNIIKTMAAELEFDVENETKTNFDNKYKLLVTDKHLRHRKQIAKVVDSIFDLKIDKKCPILCLISITDNMKYKILT